MLEKHPREADNLFNTEVFTTWEDLFEARTVIGNDFSQT